MVQKGLQNQEGSGSQSYDFEEKISKEEIDRIQEGEEEVLMAKEWPESLGGTRRYYQGPKLKSGRWSKSTSRQYNKRPWLAVFKLPAKAAKSIFQKRGK